jgi:hypothetical protein
MGEYILCYGGPAEHWCPLPATRLASRKILIEQNIKKRTGPALCVLCAVDCAVQVARCTVHGVVQYTVPLEPGGSRGVARLSASCNKTMMRIILKSLCQMMMRMRTISMCALGGR